MIITLFLIFTLLGSMVNCNPRKIRGDTNEYKTQLTYSCLRYDFKCKIDQAFQSFEKLSKAQSQSVEQATEEYQRRYGRKPPPRFQARAQFAIQHNVTLLDEFDRIEAGLAPFHCLKLTQKQIINRKTEVYKLLDLTLIGTKAVFYLTFLKKNIRDNLRAKINRRNKQIVHHTETLPVLHFKPSYK